LDVDEIIGPVGTGLIVDGGIEGDGIVIEVLV